FLLYFFCIDFLLSRPVITYSAAGASPAIMSSSLTSGATSASGLIGTECFRLFLNRDPFPAAFFFMTTVFLTGTRRGCGGQLYLTNDFGPFQAGCFYFDMCGRSILLPCSRCCGFCRRDRRGE